MVEPHIKPQLESNFFKSLDPKVKARLDQCLNTDFLHIGPGKRGAGSPEADAVTALQAALKLIKEKLPLALPDIKDSAGDYGANTITAVLRYKSDPSHVIERTGQRLDNIVGRMTLTQIDDDLVIIEGKSKPAPTPPPTPSRDLDVFIQISGFANNDEQGKDLSQRVDALQFAVKVNTLAYLEKHPSVALIWFQGGQDNNPNSKIIERVTALNNDTSKKIGRVIVTGGSAGGKNVLQVLPRLIAMNLPIIYVAIWDGAFQRDDLVDPGQFDNDANFDRDNPTMLLMKGVPGLNPTKGSDNYFQSWGHCLDKNQEIHGQVVGFLKQDLTKTDEIQRIARKFDSIFFKTGSDKQKALEDAHVSAFNTGRRASDAKALSLLTP
jgi:hypothetical protein